MQIRFMGWPTVDGRFLDYYRDGDGVLVVGGIVPPFDPPFFQLKMIGDRGLRRHSAPLLLLAGPVGKGLDGEGRR